MSLTYRGYTLNSLGDTPWYPTELALFEAMLDKLPTAGTSYVNTEHFHNRLAAPTLGTTIMYVDDSSRIWMPGLTGSSGQLILLASGRVGVTGLNTQQGATGVGITGPAGPQGQAGTGFTGMVATEIIFGNGMQSSNLQFTGTIGISTVGVCGTFLAAGTANDGNERVAIGMDGNAAGFTLKDLGNGVPAFDNHAHNVTVACTITQAIGAGNNTDGGLILRSWGLTGVNAAALEGVVSSPKGTANKSTVVLRGYAVDGSQGLTGLSPTSKLLAIQNGTNNVVTVNGQGDINTNGYIYWGGQSVTGMNVDNNLVGITGLSNNAIWWSRIGGLVDVWADIAGETGPGGLVELNLPFTSNNNYGSMYFTCRILQNGTPALGLATIGQGASVIQIYPDIIGNSWTTDKSRAFDVHFRYHV